MFVIAEKPEDNKEARARRAARARCDIGAAGDGERV